MGTIEDQMGAIVVQATEEVHVGYILTRILHFWDFVLDFANFSQNSNC